MGNLYFATARYGLLIIVPILTMRMFAEERKKMEQNNYLLTSPRSITEIVLGKYFAAISVIIITLIFSLIYYGILCFLRHQTLYQHL